MNFRKKSSALVLKRGPLRNLMTTATPECVRRVKEEIVYVDTDVLHCKTNK